MSNSNRPIDHSWLMPPDAVAISEVAMALFRDFSRELAVTFPEHDWIATFDWADERRIRYPRQSNEWRDLGAGFDLGAHRRDEMPPDAIGMKDGLAYAVQLPSRLRGPVMRIHADLGPPARIYLD